MCSTYFNRIRIVLDVKMCADAAKANFRPKRFNYSVFIKVWNALADAKTQQEIRYLEYGCMKINDMMTRHKHRMVSLAA